LVGVDHWPYRDGRGLNRVAPEEKDRDVHSYVRQHTTIAPGAGRAMWAALTPACSLPLFGNQPSRLVKREGKRLPSTLESPVH